MEPSKQITLQAFVNALSQLDQPLPPDIQQQLNQLGKTLTVNSIDIESLDKLAQSYDPLAKAYQEQRVNIKLIAATRNKGLTPEEIPNQPTPEIVNVARNTFRAENSVDAAKELAKQQQKPNPLQRLGSLFRGQK